MTHSTNHQMYVMRPDTTLYTCSTGQHRGRHLRYKCIIIIVILNTKYSGRLPWI